MYRLVELTIRGRWNFLWKISRYGWEKWRLGVVQSISRYAQHFTQQCGMRGCTSPTYLFGLPWVRFINPLLTKGLLHCNDAFRSLWWTDLRFVVEKLYLMHLLHSQVPRDVVSSWNELREILNWSVFVGEGIEESLEWGSGWIFWNNLAGKCFFGGFIEKLREYSVKILAHWCACRVWNSWWF